jgi:hypothetical protein
MMKAISILSIGALRGAGCSPATLQHCSPDPVQQGSSSLGGEIADVIASAYLSAAFGASEATIFSKRGSPRSGSQRGCSFKAP